MKKKHHIKTLIEQGEHLKLDFKFEISDAAKIARSLVAFANTDGGKLLIGVKDNGDIAGVRSNEEYFMLENAAQRFCQPEVEFTSKEWIVDAKKVLEVTIRKSPSAPHRAPDNNGYYKAYLRVADQNLLANGVLMKVWKRKAEQKDIKISYTQTESGLLQYIKKNGSITLDDFKTLSQISKFKAESILADFIVLDILRMELYEYSAKYFLKEEDKEF